MITEESSLVEVEVEFFLELFSDVFGVVFRETSDRDPELNANYITALVGFSPTSDLEIDYRRWKDTLDNKMVWSFYCSDGFLILSALYFPQRRCVGPPVVIIKQLNNTPDNGRGGTLEMLSPSSVLGTLQMHFHLTD